MTPHMSETKALASYVVDNQLEDIPTDVRHEARRAIVNYMGCAVGGAPHPAMDITLRALGPYAGKPTSSVLGRAERIDPLHASLLNGISSHVYDYDDTTPKNYSHPTSPVASALFAYASVNPVSGRDFIHAFILGFEAESRVANAVYPAHYDAGWHITGTSGVFGAAAAIGRLMQLSEQEMIWAIGLAATQAAGLREMFGSMAKAFHPGRSAQNGYASALLAKEGFTAGIHGIEGPRGFAAVQAAHYDLSKITAGLGIDFDLRANTYKPYPCGIVNHPTIDGAIQLHDAHGIAPESIAAVRLRVAPLVMDLCNQQNITVGLQGKFSVYHGAAIGLVLRQSRTPGIQRRDRQRSPGQARARAGHCGGRPVDYRGSGAHRSRARGRTTARDLHREVARQSESSNDRSPARHQVPRSGGAGDSGPAGRGAAQPLLAHRRGGRCE